MGIPGSANLLLLGGGAEAYQIDNSLRFRTSATPSLTRNQVTPTNGNSVTWSAWAKHGFEQPSQGGGYGGCIRGQGNYPTTTALYFYAYASGGSTLGWSQNWGVNASGKGTTNFDSGANTGQQLRDPSAWYHILIQLGSGVSNGCMRMFINGEEVSYQKNDNVCAEVYRWQTGPENIGNFGGASQTWSGLLAEVRQIDGQILAPTDFGEYNADGTWVPIDYTGTYGNNGYYLDFSSPSNIGADRSGNGNNFTASGFELSSTNSTSYDWMADSPTNNSRAWNALVPDIDMYPVYSEASMRVTSQGFGINLPSTGKWYWETTSITNYGQSGLIKQQANTNATSASFYSEVRSYYDSGVKYNGTVSSYGASWTTNDVIGAAVDMDNGTITMYKNGVSQGTMFSDINSSTSPGGWKPFVAQMACNFGQKTFRYTPPAGFEPLSTAKLPDAAITDPSEHFRTFTASGSSIVTNAFSQFPNGLWYFKSYTNSQDHWWRDSLNGASKSWHTPGQDVRTMETISGNAVAAGWATNASGLNAAAGFQMITYSGNSSARTIAHSLGVVPAMMWVKCTNANANTVVYHQNLNANQFLSLNNGNQPQTDNQKWNNTRPTASVFSLGTNNEVNATGRTYVAYIWAEVPGYSAFGRYNGNNNSNGVFIYNGFRPRVVCTKQINGNNGWFWRNASLDTYNPVKNITVFNETAYQQRDYIDFLSNGWKARCGGGVTDGSGTNTGEYVYFAFAEHPFGGGNVSPAPAR